MRVVQLYREEGIRVGLLEEERIHLLESPRDLLNLLHEGGDLEITGRWVPLHEAILAPPITYPSKIIAVGLNYKDHAEESKGEIPGTPLVFAKFPSSVIGHGETIVWDEKVTRKVDFEAELAVVLGKRVRNCPESEIMDAVFGYTCANDVSARDLQFGDGQWVRGKSLDTFCPIGPWIVTPEEITDPHSLAIRCWVGNRLMQDSNTNRMIFQVPALLSFLSRHFTLLPGDVVLTGTPSGVGAFREPSFYLSDGDEVTVEIERIGRLQNPCRVL